MHSYMCVNTDRSTSYDWRYGQSIGIMLKLRFHLLHCQTWPLLMGLQCMNHSRTIFFPCCNIIASSLAITSHHESITFMIQFTRSCQPVSIRIFTVLASIIYQRSLLAIVQHYQHLLTIITRPDSPLSSTISSHVASLLATISGFSSSHDHSERSPL